MEDERFRTLSAVALDDAEELEGDHAIAFERSRDREHGAGRRRPSLFEGHAAVFARPETRNPCDLRDRCARRPALSQVEG
jgi:hypothetical protein